MDRGNVTTPIIGSANIRNIESYSNTINNNKHQVTLVNAVLKNVFS